MAKKKADTVLARAATRVGRALGTAARTLAAAGGRSKAAKPAAKPAKVVKTIAPKTPRPANTPVPQKVKRGQVVDERAIVRASAAPRWSNRKPR
ncbi:MAG: hypothetical protein NUW22_15100 [Acidobacteria bacterium]|nr:hypothetical protein [Acidobacteriota bacterium]